MYRDWRGTVYPSSLPQHEWFDCYSTMFDSVEINNTFYRLPDPKTVQQWADQAPPGFLYALKLGRFGTHRKKLRDAQSWLCNHVARAELLGAALGPTLVQLPPNWRRDVGRLDAFLALAPTDMRWAVEFRDPSWLHDDTYKVLADHGAALCIHDLLADHPVTLTADWTYLRFHGPEARSHPYQGRYTGRRLWRTAAVLNDWLADGIDVHCYFNNDESGYAAQDAHWLQQRLV